MPGLSKGPDHNRLKSKPLWVTKSIIPNISSSESFWQSILFMSLFLLSFHQLPCFPASPRHPCTRPVRRLIYPVAAVFQSCTCCRSLSHHLMRCRKREANRVNSVFLGEKYRIAMQISYWFDFQRQFSGRGFAYSYWLPFEMLHIDKTLKTPNKEGSQYGTTQYNGGLLVLQKREYLAKTCYHHRGWKEADIASKPLVLGSQKTPNLGDDRNLCNTDRKSESKFEKCQAGESELYHCS